MVLWTNIEVAELEGNSRQLQTPNLKLQKHQSLGFVILEVWRLEFRIDPCHVIGRFDGLPYVEEAAVSGRLFSG
jgi:hypothetical protein